MRSKDLPLNLFMIQIATESAVIMQAKDPEDIKPLINRWLVEYTDASIPFLARGQLNREAQEALRSKYKLAQKMDQIIRERAERRQRGDSNITLHEHQTKAYVQEAFRAISNVEKREKLLEEVFENKQRSKVMKFQRGRERFTVKMHVATQAKKRRTTQEHCDSKKMKGNEEVI
ncbi:PREDICTED: uncharacterized protein LOC108971800 [Bactrocera latifrons]|uniref:Uncharacterized protein n=1 Tax=Bactrocera latifrons TaxID=174628 RepID=A0A0K8WEH1_BACLA|nr:PREDICTED: uncharacterized protein LOC108971800 [Bactrocera latifrons]